MTPFVFTRFRIFVLAAFAVLFFRLAWLQLYRGGAYRVRAEENRIRAIPIEAPRGIIFDRRGVPLVRNAVSFAVEAVPQEAAGNLERLNEVISALRLDRKKVIRKLFGHGNGIQPIILKGDLSFREFARVIEFLPSPGIYTLIIPAREYLYPLRDSHLLGYVGEIGESQLKEKKYAGLQPNDWIGQDGIEETYDRFLRGVNGAEQLEVDAEGNAVRVLDEVPPQSGRDLYLTIDAALQEAAWKALQKEIGRLKARNGIASPGSVIALDPKNGEILAYVSWPAFNPNWFIRGMTQRQYDSILKAGFDPLLNRPIQAAYPCGSTFKMITGSAGLQEKVISVNRPLYCPGYYHIPGMTFNCFLRSGHGMIKFVEAVAQSCDAYFYQVGDRLGIDHLDQYASSFGIGRPAGVDLPGEWGGLLPTPAWKKRVYHEDWYRADTINMSIGQGYLEVTPLQLADVTEAVADGGTLWRPHLFKRVSGSPPPGDLPQYPEKIRTLPVDPKILEWIRLGMKGAVDHGTAMEAKLPHIIVAGKTGTAENVPTVLNPQGRNHAWFASFAPFGRPQLVVVVMLEQSGGYGGEFAAPIARRVYEAYFKERQ